MMKMMMMMILVMITLMMMTNKGSALFGEGHLAGCPVQMMSTDDGDNYCDNDHTNDDDDKKAPQS